MSVLVICEILWMFVNTLTPDDKYYLQNSEVLAYILPDSLYITEIREWKIHV